MIQIVIGFFATAGAAGADFGMNARNQSDVRWGGLVGIALAIFYAGGLPLLSVAGAHGLNPAIGNMNYESAITASGGMLASAMFLSVRHRQHHLRLLLRLHRRQQLLHHDSRRAAHGFHHGRRHRVHHPRGYRSG